MIDLSANENKAQDLLLFFEKLTLYDKGNLPIVKWLEVLSE